MSLPHHPALILWRRFRPRFGAALQIAYAVAREIRAGGLDYRAMSLVYTSLLALVPLLAVSFSMLKAFGAEIYLEPFLLETLDPLGDRASAVAAKILDTVKRLKVGVLGFVGVVFLFYTSVSLLEKIEESFNHIWRVRASRSLVRRFSDYVSFTLLGPLVVLSAFGGLTGLLGSSSKAGWGRGALSLAGQGLHALLPYVFIMAAFSAAYLYIPNARVHARAALIGGVAAGIAWKLAGWAFAAFVAGSAQYSALYSSFAILALFMIWLYVSWLILLLGVQVAFFCQHPRHIRFPPGQLRLNGSLSEQLGIAVMLLIGRSFLRGEPAWTAHRLAEHFDLPEDCIAEILELFTVTGLLLKTQHHHCIYLPARDLAAISLVEIVRALRRQSDAWVPDARRDTFPAASEMLQTELDAAVAGALGQRNLRQLCELAENDS